MASTLTLLRRLTTEKVEFVLVGGFAAIAHGSATVTEDVDICVRFDAPTMTGVLRAVSDLHPRQRMHPSKPPLSGNLADVVGLRNLYLTTDEGDLDLLGTITGLGDYERVSQNAVRLQLADFGVRVVGLKDLVAAKRALGRPKDVRTALELERVLRKKEEV